jgi:DNA-binding response OmpR family regulator
MAQILLLETDRQLAKSLKDYFGRAGHSLVCYSDPQQAVVAADRRQPQVIILDLMLAGRSGIEFLYELRSYPDWQAIPVIVTGSLSQEDLQVFADSFAELGVSKYLHRQTTSLPQLLAEAQKLLVPAAV